MSKIATANSRKRVIGLTIVLVILLCGFAINSASAKTAVSSKVSGTARAAYPPYPVNMYEFYRADCPHCQALMPTIDALANSYPTLHVYKYETQNDANYSLFLRFMHLYGMKFDAVPTVIIGSKYFQGDVSEIGSPLKAQAASAIQTGASGKGDQLMGRVYPIYKAATTLGAKGNTTENAAAQGNFPLPLFITTGLVSGVNPCVFSVLIFLMSTLAVAGSRGRMLAVGVTYIATVFVVFFLSALAVVQFVRVIGEQNLALAKMGIGVFLLIVGIVSIKDFFWYNRWFSFKIPTFTKHSISYLGKTGSFLAIIMLGFIATIAALPCTIGPFTFFSANYLSSMTAMENNLYTGLFTLAFTIPMILLFVGIYAVKVGTDRAEEWRMKSARYMKLATGLLMVAFGLLLVFKVF